MAKINLTLKVGAKRGDGYHEIDSLCVPIDLYDTLEFAIGGGNEGENNVTMVCEGLDEVFARAIAATEPEQNTVTKAIRLFREETDFRESVTVRVIKRLPCGGGLGAGSSDGTVALAALNNFCGRPLTERGMEETAAKAGMDCVFFVRGQAARLLGRGEVVVPEETPRLDVVLVNPGFPSGTKLAYSLIDSLSPEERVSGNDFLDLFLRRGGEEAHQYKKIISELQNLGACKASLSGSGSTCFGVFDNAEDARAAAEKLTGKWPFVRACRTVPR